MDKQESKNLTRRDFLKTTAVASSAVLWPSTLFAAGQDKIRLALIGCGGRGNGALNDCLQAASSLGMQVEITALADFFKERALKTAQDHNVPAERCFEGPKAYQQALASEADVVLLVTPPVFRPRHFEAAVAAGKHVFMEKPVAVDAPGARKILEVGRTAAAKGLAVCVGAQRRHQASYLQTKYAVDQGVIGTILAGQVWWCMGHLWYNKRRPGETDAEYLVRNWVSFTEMSGDHIVEQHFHNIDVANWFLGKTPKQCVGFGGRARRVTGNQFDFFSVDFDYGSGIHIHSMCRQVDGCYNRVAEFFTGTQGTTAGSGPVNPADGKKITIPEMQLHENPYVQEHIDLLKSIRDGKPLQDAQWAAETNLTALMGRISAYTGQLVRWQDLTDPQSKSPWYNLTLSPTAEDFENGAVQAPPDDVFPIPGVKPSDA
ncbi:MAG TPA: Gfo/Idh/MocA family oxidoreductase [Anaerohalosphaeraceae bacterium]|nr:Gfo/Idh/MocA family oxidoreductase [Anaerohalosphaeraceae bacterium]HPB93480.1 Gfo/Idh/MocA family oxidoreductase [Anaerohalosphaeraceae bacterium]HRT23823.1 Gfo/Idh/MocA family oxidoreductase [Anaerohalosphaeraceae bacterium]